MIPLKHFIIFHRTDGHCAVWLAHVPTLGDALFQYALDQGAEQREDGRLTTSDGYGGQIVYEHPLAFIEGTRKIWDGWSNWNGWEIRELQPGHWQAPLAEVFCSENPYDIEGYVEHCRPLLRQRYPRSRARAFVWYLKDGPLVTFYRSARRGRRWPIEILGRYYLPWSTYPQVQEWEGTYDTLMEQLSTEVPLAYPVREALQLTLCCQLLPRL